MTCVEEAGLPPGTTLTVKDLFFNTPARRKFLKSESTELQHIAALVTHYALANPRRHFELHSATQALLVAPAVADAGRAAVPDLRRGNRRADAADRRRNGLYPRRPARASALASRRGLRSPGPGLPPPLGLCVEARAAAAQPATVSTSSSTIALIRDRLVLHALQEAYRNIIPPTSFPVVLLFLQMPPEEVDVNGAPGQDRGALPPAKLCARLHPRHRAHHADERTAGRRASRAL